MQRPLRLVCGGAAAPPTSSSSIIDSVKSLHLAPPTSQCERRKDWSPSSYKNARRTSLVVPEPLPVVMDRSTVAVNTALTNDETSLVPTTGTSMSLSAERTPPLSNLPDCVVDVSNYATTDYTPTSVTPTNDEASLVSNARVLPAVHGEHVMLTTARGNSTDIAASTPSEGAAHHTAQVTVDALSPASTCSQTYIAIATPVTRPSPSFLLRHRRRKATLPMHQGKTSRYRRWSGRMYSANAPLLVIVCTTPPQPQLRKQPPVAP